MSKIDWRTVELWHFFSMLHFIWILPIFQFLVYALPNRMLTSPYKPKIHNLSLFCQPLHFIRFLHIFQFFAYALPIGIWQVLINPKTCFLEWVPRKLFHREKSVHCLYKTHFSKVSVVPHFPGFLWRIQNRHAHMVMSILYPSWEIPKKGDHGNFWKMCFA